jgi:hypothetical protein
MREAQCSLLAFQRKKYVEIWKCGWAELNAPRLEARKQRRMTLNWLLQHVKKVTRMDKNMIK